MNADQPLLWLLLLMSDKLAPERLVKPLSNELLTLEQSTFRDVIAWRSF